MENKRAVSGVVTMVILIAITLAVIVVVWVVVNNLVKSQTEGAESCLDILGKVSINELYTCYDAATDEFQFSISVGDAEISSVLISISSAGTTSSFELNGTASPSNPVSYPAGGGALMPSRNSGLTYTFTGMTSEPDSFEISPVSGNKQCSVSDSLEEFDSCASLV